MKALIVGGGVAGPATAMALQRVGIDAVLLERRAARDATEGSYFTIAPNGLDALDLLGALDLAREVGFPTTTNAMYGATGRRLGEIGLGVPLADGTVALTAKRSLLAARLLDEAESRGVEVRRGAEVVAVASQDGSATVTLTEWQRRLLDLVAGDAGPAAELVAGGTLELAADNTYDLPHVPHWTRDRLVLVGDAAHAPSPSSGQGASMALEDAVVLATSLRDHASGSAVLAAGLHAYEQARRARVERIVKAGARSSDAKTHGPVGRRFREAAMSLVFRYVVTDRSTAWMTGSRLSSDGQRAA
jgi:2-polyprenyl-6-methoxyphenol hydroxylase-like FAD-dependent oxidoreductase